MSDILDTIPQENYDPSRFTEEMRDVITALSTTHPDIIVLRPSTVGAEKAGFILIVDPDRQTVAEIECDRLFGYSVNAQIAPSPINGSSVNVYHAERDHTHGASYVDEVVAAVPAALAETVSQKPDTGLPKTPITVITVNHPSKWMIHRGHYTRQKIAVAGYVYIERDTARDIAVKYHSGPVAVRALEADEFIDTLCADNALDCYAVTDPDNVADLVTRINAGEVDKITAPTIADVSDTDTNKIAVGIVSPKADKPVYLDPTAHTSNIKDGD